MNAPALLFVLSLMGTPIHPVTCVVNDNPAQPVEAPAVADRCKAPEPTDGRVSAEQLDEIMRWLSERFDLPKSSERPAVVFESPADLARKRNGGFTTHRDTQRQPDARQDSADGDIVALYSDARRTIYLSEDWTGTTDAEMSVLVHEMVHHLQNMAGVKYYCASEREKLAYQAQSAWLRQADKSLESEFQLDGLTLLVRSNCML